MKLIRALSRRAPAPNRQRTGSPRSWPPARNREYPAGSRCPSGARPRSELRRAADGPDDNIVRGAGADGHGFVGNVRELEAEPAPQLGRFAPEVLERRDLRADRPALLDKRPRVAARPLRPDRLLRQGVLLRPELFKPSQAIPILESHGAVLVEQGAKGRGAAFELRPDFGKAIEHEFRVKHRRELYHISPSCDPIGRGRGAAVPAGGGCGRRWVRPCQNQRV